MRIDQYIDHTLLRPQATQEQVWQICTEARQYGFHAVCVNPVHASLVSHELAASRVKTCVVVGFPLGAAPKEVKAFEARRAIQDGAVEIDMVINIGALKEGRYDVVEDDIRAVVKTADGKALVKTIIECCYLTDQEKIMACEIAVKAGASFVKTSTGLGSSGARLEDVLLLRQTLGDRVGIKAAGGIRDYETARAMIEAGADRLGTSSGVEIVKQALLV